MAKKLKYADFSVSVNDRWIAQDIIQEFGQPKEIIGFRKEETSDLQAVELKWPCWTLSEGDIREVAKRNGIDPDKITQEQLHNIARTFKKGMEWACDDWGDWLEEAIKSKFEEAKKNG